MRRARLPRRHCLIGAIVCFITALLPATELGLLGTGNVSLGIGEEYGVAPGVLGYHRSDLHEAVVRYDSSNKYTGAGWKLSVSADLQRPGPWSPVVGLEYSHRNGGPWTKRSLWLRGGITHDQTRLILATDTQTLNQVARLTVEHEWRHGPWRARYLFGRERFRQPMASDTWLWGTLAGLSIGMAW